MNTDFLLENANPSIVFHVKNDIMPTNHTEAEIKGRDKSPLVCNFFQL